MYSIVERFRAMGTDAEVTVVDGDAHLVSVARARVADLEARWSRFVSASEISRLNASDGRAMTLSAETVMLISRARDGYELTNGRFDPLQLDALEAVGYRTSFESIGRPTVDRTASAGHLNHAATRGPIEIDATMGRVALPKGARFDPGGIGKGLAADFVVDELRALGAAGVCVNLGGDVRVSGIAPDGDSWRVAVRDCADDDPNAMLSIADGAVATTSRSRRRWQSTAGDEFHHIIDPDTGTSATTPVLHATAIASQGWQAEVLSKVAFLDRSAGINLAERVGATALVATALGIAVGPSWDRFARTMEIAA